MKKFFTVSTFVAMIFSSAAVAQERGEAAPTSPPPSFAGKSIDELSADEVLKLVRYSYTLYDRDFTGVLRMGLTTKVPFIMSLKPESIRFIFNDPAQVILLDTKNSSFALYEGIGGAELKGVNASKFDDQIRGTDVTYDDLSMRFLYWPNAKIVRTDKVKGRDSWIVRVRNPATSGAYATVDVWIDKASGGMIKMIGYNREGRPIRRFEVLHGKKFGDVWMVDEMRIETVSPTAGGHVTSSTRMSIKSAVD
ncbi:MAG: outer membrane lipoprotein-sorting protein [Verrucomicrobiales bacterium]|nr:outer membrane lipoprotein-sorting protein [Verrucomicrobiales bacterium]